MNLQKNTGLCLFNCKSDVATKTDIRGRFASACSLSALHTPRSWSRFKGKSPAMLSLDLAARLEDSGESLRVLTVRRYSRTFASDQTRRGASPAFQPTAYRGAPWHRKTCVSSAR